MSGLFQSVLERARQEKKLLSLRTSHTEPGRFAIGYVLSFSEEVVMLRVINRDGMPTAIQSFSMMDVFQLTFNDQYTRHVEFKADNLDKVYGGMKSPAFLDEPDLTMQLMLERALQAGQLVNVYTHLGLNYYGYVRQLSPEQVLWSASASTAHPMG
ncbi:hypothetical protein GCM10027346_05280 [Hymenobacter seoulensis]